MEETHRHDIQFFDLKSGILNLNEHTFPVSLITELPQSDNRYSILCAVYPNDADRPKLESFLSSKGYKEGINWWYV
jgi:hypothetical protein